ncbi:MAG TPA: hypothetical protein VGD90_06245 [Sphingobacteriaceae bacterium]
MNTIKFKTNIKCNGCLTAVTPFLNKTVGEQQWEVDLQDPQRILSVEGATESEVINAVKEAGFQAEKI